MQGLTEGDLNDLMDRSESREESICLGPPPTLPVSSVHRNRVNVSDRLNADRYFQRRESGLTGWVKDKEKEVKTNKSKDKAIATLHNLSKTSRQLESLHPKIADEIEELNRDSLNFNDKIKQLRTIHPNNKFKVKSTSADKLEPIAHTTVDLLPERKNIFQLKQSIDSICASRKPSEISVINCNLESRHPSSKDVRIPINQSRSQVKMRGSAVSTNQSINSFSALMLDRFINDLKKLSSQNNNNGYAESGNRALSIPSAANRREDKGTGKEATLGHKLPPPVLAVDAGKRRPHKQAFTSLKRVVDKVIPPASIPPGQSSQDSICPGRSGLYLLHRRHPGERVHVPRGSQSALMDSGYLPSSLPPGEEGRGKDRHITLPLHRLNSRLYRLR